jgi:hypothetical protein
MPSVTRLPWDVAAKIGPLVTAWSRQGRQWLKTPIAWADLRARLIQLLSTYAGVGIVLLLLLLLLLLLPWYAVQQKDEKGVVTYPHASLTNPILGGLGALFLIYAAIRQARTATERHEAQTKADQQRRITESFSKAIEQLGDDKLEVRLGGIYALEQISQESPQHHWTVMENMTAFVRERTRRMEAERLAKPLEQRIREIAYSLWERAGKPEGRSEEFWAEAVKQEQYGDQLATDIAAVLTVIQRRSEDRYELEGALNFRGAVLRGAELSGVHLQRADLSGANLRRAYLNGAHLEDARLAGAHLEEAELSGANLRRAYLVDAHLEDARLGVALLEYARLTGAHLQRAHLRETHLDGADLRGAEGLTQAQIDQAFGDVATALTLPRGRGLTPPAHWTGVGGLI